jgi:hypothetical protein
MRFHRNQWELKDIEKESRDAVKIFWGLIIFFAAFIIQKFFIEKEINEKGVYTKGTILSAVTSKGGLNVVVTYKFKGAEYKESEGTTSLDRHAIGRQFFIKVFPNAPDYILIQENSPVPDCLLYIDPPAEGWKKKPECP